MVILEYSIAILISIDIYCINNKKKNFNNKKIYKAISFYPFNLKLLFVLKINFYLINLKTTFYYIP